MQMECLEWRMEFSEEILVLVPSPHHISGGPLQLKSWNMFHNSQNITITSPNNVMWCDAAQRNVSSSCPGSSSLKLKRAKKCFKMQSCALKVSFVWLFVACFVLQVYATRFHSSYQHFIFLLMWKPLKQLGVWSGVESIEKKTRMRCEES